MPEPRRRKKKARGRTAPIDSPEGSDVTVIRANGRTNGPNSGILPVKSQVLDHSPVLVRGSPARVRASPRSSAIKSIPTRPQHRPALAPPDLSSDDEFFSADEFFDADSSHEINMLPSPPPTPPSRRRAASPPMGTWTSPRARTTVRTYKPIPIDLAYPKLPTLRRVSSDVGMSQISTQSSGSDLGVSFEGESASSATTADTSINLDSFKEEEYQEIPTDVDEEDNDTEQVEPQRRGRIVLPPPIEPDSEDELDALRQLMEGSDIDYDLGSGDARELSNIHRALDDASFDPLIFPPAYREYEGENIDRNDGSGDISNDDEFGGDDFGLEEGAVEELLQKAASIKHEVLPFGRFPYFVQYEITRVSLAIGASLSQCETNVPKVAERFCYPLCNAPNVAQFWRAMKRFASELAMDLGLFAISSKIPPPPVESSWMALRHTKTWPVGFELIGKCAFTVSGADCDDDFTVQLQPLNRRNMGSRFSARFGGDRFLFLRVAPPKIGVGLTLEDVQREIAEVLVGQVLSLVGRMWRCITIKQEEKKIRVDGYTEKDKYIVAIFFAEWGAGLGKSSALLKQQLCLEEQPEINRKEMSRDELVAWAIPLHKEFGSLIREIDPFKRGGKFAKLWARISLSLTPSRPTVQFNMKQIEVVPDIKSPTGVVMTDGCAVCSSAVLRTVRELLGLNETPAAVQGRLGGAKGMWFADPDEAPDSNELWIKITPSMLKYKFHDEDKSPHTADWARLTLFVVDYSKPPSSAKLNSQLVPILTERKVPFEVLKEILEEHLDRELDVLMQAAQNRITLRAWLSGPGGGVRERTANESRQYESGGLPLSINEQLTMLLDAGFEPTTCEFVMEKLSKMVETQCENVVDHIHIGVPRSTYVYCIADPTGTLKPGEISVQFSRGFVDDISKDHLNWLKGDVLVARNPAHLPTDIQKVAAVVSTHDGLNKLQNVAVFSTQGHRPLADLLSGGDYDGDKVWICWDKRVVDTFCPSKNTKFLYDENKYFETQQMLGDALSNDITSKDFYEKFFKLGFSIALRESQLGYCTSILDKCMYALGRKLVMNGTILKLGMLCSTFVDAPKRGLVPTQETRDELLRLSNAYFDKPRYKSPKGDRPRGDPQDWFILDRLVFEVAKGKADEKMRIFDAFRSSAMDRTDPHLSSVYRREWELCKTTKNKPLESIILRLLHDLRDLKEKWGRAMNPKLHGRDFDFEVEYTEIVRQYNEIMPLPSELHDPTIACWADHAEEPFSHWKFLKASTAYFVCQGGRGSKFAWWMTADYLCYIKATEGAKQGALPPPRIVSRDMYDILKPNSKVISKFTIEDEDD